MMSYPLGFFENCDNLKILPNETLEIIKFLAKKVGARDYVKTPNFKKKITKHSQDWESIRNFKATEFIVKETELTKISCLLNKIIPKNYDVILSQIIVLLEVMVKKEDSKNNLLKISNYIFEISSANNFYSKLYAKLYDDLINKFPIMKDICNTNFKMYFSLFDTIKIINSDDDYILFCENNRKNDKIKSLSLYFVNLMKLGVIDVSKIFNLINFIQERIEKYIHEDDKRGIVEIFVENIFIIISNGKDLLKLEEKKWDTLINTIEKFTLLKSKDFPSFSNKSLFKYMDIIDII